MHKIPKTLIIAIILLAAIAIDPVHSNDKSKDDNWKRTEDIESCIDKAIRDNIDIKIGQSKVKISEAKKKKAMAKRYPYSSAEITVVRDTERADYGFSATNGSEIDLEAYLPLIYFGANKYSIEVQKAAQKAELLRFMQTNIDTECKVFSIYLDIIKARRLMNSRKFTIKAIEQYISNHRTDERKFERLSLLIKTIENDMLDDRTNLAHLVAKLNKFLNTNKLRPETDFITFGTIESYDMTEIVKKHITKEDLTERVTEYASRYSPDWQATKYDIAQAEYNLKLARTALFPKVNAYAEYDVERLGNSKTWTVGLKTYYNPISPTDWSEIGVKKEEANLSVLTKEKFVSDREYEIESDIILMLDKSDNITLQTKSLLDSGVYLKMLTEKNVDGNESELTLADAFNEYYKKNVERISSIYEHLKTKQNLCRVTGMSIHLQSPNLLLYVMNPKEYEDYDINNLFYDFFLYRDMREALHVHKSLREARDRMDFYKGKMKNPLNGWQLAHFAAMWCNEEMMEELIESGDDINATAKDGTTPLYVAVTKGRSNIAKLLIDAGADINIPAEDWKWKPIQKAANRGHYEICKMLIEKGADINEKTITGKNALHIAIQQGHTKIVKLLVESGADLTEKTPRGLTPLQLSELEGFLDISEYLSKAEKNSGLKSKRLEIKH